MSVGNPRTDFQHLDVRNGHFAVNRNQREPIHSLPINHQFAPAVAGRADLLSVRGTREVALILFGHYSRVGNEAFGCRHCLIHPRVTEWHGEQRDHRAEG